MPTYLEHRRLIAMVRELAALLDRQSLLLLKLARRKAIPAAMDDNSPLIATWANVGTAFQFLAHHANSIEAEFKRLHIGPDDKGG